MMPIDLDRLCDISLQEQIYRWIRDRIIAGALPEGARLTSTRDLARGLGVSRNTVVLAYEWLAAEGYLSMRPGTGAFVARVVLDRPPVRGDDPAVAVSAVAAGVEMPSTATVTAPALSTAGAPRAAFDFWYGRPDPRLFPAHAWRAIGTDVLGGCAVGMTEYGAIGGDPALRRAIASHVAGMRGIAAGPDQVIVTTGAQEALNLVARLFLCDGATAVVEDPGYAAAGQVFLAHGADLCPVAVDDEGLNPTGLRGLRPRLVYVTPSHQFPTGAVMSLARRRALIEHCGRYGGIIVEDDYDGEIVYDRPPIAALAALDTTGRTVYIGSFSKTLGGGLRIGYIVVPPQFVAAAQATKSLMSYGQSWLDQQILAHFIASGRYRRHLNRLRTIYRARRDAAIAGLRAVFADAVDIQGSDSGLHLYCRLAPRLGDAAAVAARARAAGVGLHPAAQCGIQSREQDLSRALLVGFAGLALRRDQRGIPPTAARGRAR